MERISSFSVDHTKLKKGVYISRVDSDITTYDIRMVEPNQDKPLDPRIVHTIEHLGATLLRNSKYQKNIIYFGPMGCMTGFYLLTKELDLKAVKALMKDVYTSISTWDNEIPGATKQECGNYLYMDLKKAKQAAKEFINIEWQDTYHYL